MSLDAAETDWLARGREYGAACRLPLPRQALTGAVGERLGHGVGASLEFQDYREYQPGDDLRRLDWRAYARTDRLMVRLYREEIQPHLDLISDCSRSMTAPAPAKRQAALMLAGVFGEAAFQGGLSVAWHGFGAGWREVFPRANAWPPCPAPDCDGTGTLGDELAAPPPPLVRRGLRVGLSDWLWEGDPQPVLRRLSANAAVVLLVNILAADELDPPDYGAVGLYDVETGGRLDLQVGPEEVKAYRERLAAHLRLWGEAAARCACRFLTVRAEDILAGDLAPLHAAGFLES